MDDYKVFTRDNLSQKLSGLSFEYINRNIIKDCLTNEELTALIIDMPDGPVKDKMMSLKIELQILRGFCEKHSAGLLDY